MKLIQMSNKASLNEISYFFLHLWHYDLIKIKRRDVRERAVTRSRLHVSSGILLNVLEHFVFFFSRTNKIMWITWSRRSLPQPKRSMNCCLAETRVKVISTGRAKQLYGIQCLRKIKSKRGLWFVSLFPQCLEQEAEKSSFEQFWD